MARTDNRRDLPPVTRIGNESAWDLYASLLHLSWPQIFALILAFYTATNVVFALVYLAFGHCINNAREGSFEDAFFFSVQTLATIGYGGMTPEGVIGNTIVAFESLVGLVAVAMMTGLVFTRFSRPTARILWAEHLVVSRRNGVPTLQLRVANARGNNVIEATVKVGVLLDEVSAEGEQMRRMHDLHLVRSTSPLFTLTFTAMHVIDETSPLYGFDADKLRAEDGRIFVNVSGLDATFNQTIHATRTYLCDDVKWDHKYVDVIERRGDGTMVLHLEKFHDVEPIGPVS